MSATDLLPELHAENDGKGISPIDFAYATASSDIAVALADLFWPTFVAFESYVLLSDFDIARLREWQSRPGMKNAEIEWFMNQLDLGTMFWSEERTGLVESRIVFLRDTLMDAYRTKLAAVFFDRSFAFHLLNNEECGFTFQQTTT